MTSREVSEQTLLMIGIWLKSTERQHTLFHGYFIKLHFPRYFGFWTLSCHAVLWFMEYVLASRVSNSAILSNLQESSRYAEGAFFFVESVLQQLQQTQSGALGITFQNNPSSNVKSWCNWTHLNPKYLLIANLTKELEELKQNKVQKQGTKMVSWLTDF